MNITVEVSDSRFDEVPEGEVVSTVLDMIRSGAFDLREADAFEVKLVDQLSPSKR